MHSTTRLCRRRWWAGAVAALLVLAPACSEGGGGDDATVVVGDGDATGSATTLEPGARLAAAVEQVQEAASFRFDMKMWMIVAGDGERLHVQPHEPVAVGELAGERYRVVMDFGVLFREMAAQLGPEAGGELAAFEAMVGDLTMEMVVDGDVMYLRAPLFAGIAQFIAPEDPATAEAFTALGEGWGRLDLAALDGVVPSHLAGQITGTQSMDPTQMLDLLYGAGGEVRELGRTSVAGVEVTGLTAEVSLRELLEAQGADVDALLGGMGATADNEQVTAALADMKMPIAVFVDGEGLVRRVQLEMDMADVIAAVPELGADAPPDAHFEFGVTMDFADYGDPSIVVTPPDPTTTVDLAGPLLALSDQFEGG